MYVCKQCHEKDAHTIECDRTFIGHTTMIHIETKCEVCGKPSNPVAYCYSYNKYRAKTVGKI